MLVIKNIVPYYVVGITVQCLTPSASCVRLDLLQETITHSQSLLSPTVLEVHLDIRQRVAYR